MSVCWYHFTHGHPAFLGPGLLMQSGTYGWVGVEIFFVISGFILPYALYSSGFELSFTTYRLFLAKRIIRLDPPYLATIVLVIALNYLSSHLPGYRGEAMHISWVQLAAHIGYLSGLLKQGWVNPVFWTLAIEFQFYLSIALLFPLISSKHAPTRLATQCSLLALAMIPAADTVILHYLFLFVAGITTFQARVKLSKPMEWIPLLTICGIGAAWYLEPIVAAVGLSTAFAILTVTWQNRVLHFLGTLSYSIYLVHLPVGARVIQFAERFHSGMLVKLLILAGALAVTIAAAYLMYWLVERPAQTYAGRIKMRRPAAPVAKVEGCLHTETQGIPG
jgi:peptidoglycan/LPS O-acetylase OafA/YrhL